MTFSRVWAALSEDALEAAAIIASKDATVAALQEEILAKNSQIQQLQAQISALNAQVSAQAAQIASLNATIAAKDAQISELQARIAELEAGGGGNPTPTDPLAVFGAMKYQMRRAWFQEDVQAGPVAAWSSRGSPALSAVQGSGTLQPTKLLDNGGVEFTVGTQQALTFGLDQDAYLNNRNVVVVARTDLAASSLAFVQYFAVNGISTSVTSRQPIVQQSNGQLRVAMVVAVGANAFVDGTVRPG